MQTVEAQAGPAAFQLPAGTVLDSTLRWDVPTSSWLEETQVQISAAGALSISDASLADQVSISHDGDDLNIAPVAGTTVQVNVQDMPILQSQALDPGAYNFEFADTFTAGAFVGGVLTSTGTITYTNAFFIWALLSENKIYAAAVNPGFAAFTLFNALPTIQNSGNFNLVQALVLNVGVNHRRTSSGTSTAVQTTAVSFAGQVRSNVSGAVMTLTTGMQGLVMRPVHYTVAGSTVNYGTITGLQCNQPAVALFGSQAGVENITAYYGIDWRNNTFGGVNRVISVVRSNQALGTNIRFLDHTGTAISRLGGHLYFTADNVGVVYGAAGIPFGDLFTFWNGSAYAVSFQGTGGDLLYSEPASDRFLMDNTGGSTTGEYNFNCGKFSLGAQTGAVGNQVGVFVAGLRSTQLGGEWSDFLLTQAANITVDHAMGGVFGWTINAPSITLGTGTVTTAGGLNVGGNVNQGSVNRFGIRVLSNPSGGSGINAALWITAGLSRFDGRVDINNGIALGGGAAATLGTIGGAGPTAAAQAQWVEIDVGGVAHWIPAWT